MGKALKEKQRVCRRCDKIFMGGRLSKICKACYLPRGNQKKYVKYNGI